MNLTPTGILYSTHLYDFGGWPETLAGAYPRNG